MERGCALARRLRWWGARRNGEGKCEMWNAELEDAGTAQGEGKFGIRNSECGIGDGGRQGGKNSECGIGARGMGVFGDAFLSRRFASVHACCLPHGDKQDGLR